MKIEIEIPKEFEEHFNADRFEDTLYKLSEYERLIARKYEEHVIATMLIQAFRDGKIKTEVTE